MICWSTGYTDQPEDGHSKHAPLENAAPSAGPAAKDQLSLPDNEERSSGTPSADQGVTAGESITSFDCLIKVKTNGDLVIDETIVLPTSSNAFKDGFIRYIPLEDVAEGEQKFVVGPILHNGHRIRGAVTTDPDGRKLLTIPPHEKRGDGQQTYKFQYLAQNIISRFDESARIKWDVTGRLKWPIEHADCTILLPAAWDVDVLKMLGYTTGKNSSRVTPARQGQRVVFSKVYVPARESLIVSLKLPNSLLARPPEADISSPRDRPGLQVHSFPHPAGIHVRYGLLSPLKREAVLVASDGSLRIIPLDNPEEASVLLVDLKRKPLWSGAYSPDGKWFVAGTASGELVVIDADTWTIQKSIEIGTKYVRTLAVSSQASKIVGEGDRQLIVYDRASNSMKGIEGTGRWSRAPPGLAISPDGTCIAVGATHDIYLYDQNLDHIHTIDYASYPLRIAFSPDGSEIASSTGGGINKMLAVFPVRPSPGKEKIKPIFRNAKLPHKLNGVALNPMAPQLATTGCDTWVRIYDALSGEEMFGYKRNGCTRQPSFGDNGKLLGWSESQHYCWVRLPDLQ